MDTYLNKDTTLCMSLSGRPSNFGTRFHNFLYRELGINFIYKAFSTSNLHAAIEGIRALGIRGCSISMPFKEKCIAYLDEIDSSAQGIVSVNTIVNNGTHLTGYNTDYTAVSHLLKTHEIPTSFCFAVLGSGGMAKAVVCALRNTGFKKGIIVARNSEAGTKLAEQYGFEWLPEMGDRQADLIINVTPIGMTGGKEVDSLAFGHQAIQSAHSIFDVVAFPAETPLIKYARTLGKQVISGADVVVLQAVEQFVLYTGTRPNQELIHKAANFARQ